MNYITDNYNTPIKITPSLRDTIRIFPSFPDLQPLKKDYSDSFSNSISLLNSNTQTQPTEIQHGNDSYFTGFNSTEIQLSSTRKPLKPYHAGNQSSKDFKNYVSKHDHVYVPCTSTSQIGNSNWNTPKPRNTRTYFEEILERQVKNLRVPIEETNNERFKLWTIQRIKQDTNHQPYKSACKDTDQGFVVRRYFDETMDYLKIKQKKFIHSEHKKLALNLPLIQGTNTNEAVFPVFRDNDIGITEWWQIPWVDNVIDEDCNTDDEQICISSHLSKSEIHDAVQAVKKDGKLLLPG